MSRPVLTVVAAAQTTAISACLDSLRAQSVPIEIILVDGVGGLPTTPGVRVIRPQPPFSLPRLLAAGIAAASGEVIAITETHCTFPVDWAMRVIAAHGQSAASAIGGAVVPGADLGDADLGLFYVDYGAFLPPLPSGRTHNLPGCNVSFKRAVLDAARDRFDAEGFWKTFFCQHLESEGATLERDPTLVAVYHRRMSARRIARRRFTHGRCFGGMRVLPSLSRAALVAGAPLLPFILGARLIAGLHGKVPARSWIRASPYIAIALTAWAIGEWWGTLMGPGASCDDV